FYGLDTALYRSDAHFRRLPDPTPPGRMPALGLKGKRNLPFLAVIVGAVLMSGLWQSGVAFSILGVEVALQDLARDGILIAVAI
ncbi:sodium:proton antiporter, partial [Mycobacterium tuberculosis]|nr:sodium:proton antiporter [Mycobacterium tuberculosis]